MGKYTATESDGSVEVTLKLTEPLYYTSVLHLDAYDIMGE